MQKLDLISILHKITFLVIEVVSILIFLFFKLSFQLLQFFYEIISIFLHRRTHGTHCFRALGVKKAGFTILNNLFLFFISIFLITLFVILYCDILFLKILLVELYCRQIILSSIEVQLRPYLKLEVSLVTSEAFLVHFRVHLYVTVSVRESLTSYISLDMLNMQDDVITKFDVYLIVLIHI